jgi:predicted small metal-binding protein
VFGREEAVMKILACKDGGMDCEYTAFGATAEEVIRKVSEHGGQYHGIYEFAPGYLDAWREKIHESAIDCCGVYGGE